MGHPGVDQTLTLLGYVAPFPAWRACRRLLHGGAASHENQGKVVIPVSLVLGGEDGQLLAHGAVEALHQSITLRPLGSGAGIMNAQALTHSGEHPGLKVSPLVAMQSLWHPKTAEHALQQGVGHGLSFLIGDGIGFGPLGEVVDGSGNEAVATVRAGQRPHHIHRHPLHRRAHQKLLKGSM